MKQLLVIGIFFVFGYCNDQYFLSLNVDPDQVVIDVILVFNI